VCCEPFHRGLKKAETPEELMRSRYSAFAKGEAAYILATDMSGEHTPDELEALKAEMAQTAWLKLDILDARGDTVEFKAYYRDGRGMHLLHEKSRFVYQNGEWLYVDGRIYSSRIERNETCSCGSGKKYKKCCGNS